MDTPIDKLVFALGGDVAPLNESFKQAEAGAAKTGKAIQDHIGNGFKAATGEAVNHGGKAGKAMEDIAGHAKKVGEHIQVSRRELIYMARELASGDIQRLPATLALLVSHLLEISPAAIAAAAAISAIPLAAAVSAVKADEALAKLRTSMALTANASGVSLSQATAMSVMAARQSNGSISTMGAERIMGGLMGAGVPAQYLKNATIAAGNYALASGTSQEESQGLVARMFQDPARAAEELHRSMNLLNAEEMEEVKHLANSGRQYEAAAIVLATFSDRVKEGAEQAGFWTRNWNALGNKFGNLGRNIGIDVFGTGSAQDKLDRLNQIMLPDRFSAKDKAAIMASPDYQRLAKPLMDEIAKELAPAKAAGERSQLWNSVGVGLKLAADGADAFGERIKKMGENQDAAERALAAARNSRIQVDDATMKRVTDGAKAAEDALKFTRQYGAPGMAEARQRQYSAAVAAAPISEEAKVRARNEAAEKRIQELMDPSTTLTAEQNYRNRMAMANDADTELAKRQHRRLQDLADEAKGADKVSAAYEGGTNAMQRARAEAEVDVSITNEQVAAKDRLTAVQLRLNTAMAQAREQVGKAALAAENEARASGMELAAGGDPLAQMRAAANARAFAATEDQLQMQDTPEHRFEVMARRTRMANADFQRAQNDATRGAQGDLYSANVALAGQQNLAMARGSGLTEADLRRFEVWNQTVQDFTKRGLDMAIPANQELLESMLRTNIAMSDLSDQMQKTAAEAKGLADDITGSLKDWLDNPGQDWQMAFANMGKKLLDTVVESNILDPTNKFLNNAFAGLIGGSGPLGSQSNPMYVKAVDPLTGLPTTFSGQGGLFGGGGFGGGGAGGGGMLDSLMSWLGFSGGAGGSMAGASGISEAFADSSVLADVGSSLDLSSLAMLPFFAAAGGGRKTTGSYVLVGENGPEILGPDVAGTITPLSAPSVRAATGTNAGGDGGNMSFGDMHFHLPNVQDPQGFIRSKSQLSAAVTRATSMGRRNN